MDFGCFLSYFPHEIPSQSYLIHRPNSFWWSAWLENVVRNSVVKLWLKLRGNPCLGRGSSRNFMTVVRGTVKQCGGAPDW